MEAACHSSLQLEARVRATGLVVEGEIARPGLRDHVSVCLLDLKHRIAEFILKYDLRDYNSEGRWA